MDTDLIGRRVWINEDFGTIRYLGNLNDRPDTYVGIEWDTPRGKHSGELEGVQYFTCKAPNRGSFAKQEQVPEYKDIDIQAAAVDRYCDHTTIDTQETYVETSSSFKKEIELVGMDQVVNRQSNMEELEEVTLQSCKITSVGTFSFPKAKSFLLDLNLFNDWNILPQILEQMPQLQTLSLTGNRLEKELTMSFEHNLNMIVLIDMELTWEKVTPILHGLPALQELLLYKNLCNDLSYLGTQRLQQLQRLNLEDNGIELWENVWEAFGQLPALEKFILNKNKIQSVWYSGGWQSLTALSIDNNELQQWSVVEEMNNFPAHIQELRIAGNPFQGEMGPAVMRQEIIARIHELKVLNGALIREQERTDSERMFLRRHMDEEGEVAHPRWARMVAAHGDPREVGKIAQLSEQTISNTNTSIKLVSLAAASAGKEMTKKLSLNMKVGALKNLLEKIFSVPSDVMKVSYRENKDVIMPEILDDNNKDISYYIIGDGTGEIWIEDAD